MVISVSSNDQPIKRDVPNCPCRTRFYVVNFSNSYEIFQELFSHHNDVLNPDLSSLILFQIFGSLQRVCCFDDLLSARVCFRVVVAEE